MTSCVRQIDWFLGGEIGAFIGNNYVNNQGSCFYQENSEPRQRTRNKLKHCAISVHWPKKFTDSEIAEYEYFFNIHPGYLPLGRGMYPVFWAIFFESIAGVTCHQITDVLDSGPILFREEVPYQTCETFREVSKRIFEKEIEIFLSTNLYVSKFSHNLRLLEPQYPLGKNRKKSEVQLLFNQAIEGKLNHSQLYRLMLAVSDDRVPLPEELIDIISKKFDVFKELRK